MSGLRIGFVTGQRAWWRRQRLNAKYVKMRLEGVIYPDVYCLALMLADKFDFVGEEERVGRGKYDLMLAELQGSDSQLRYLETLVEAGDPPVAVIPGPPAILSRDLTDEKLGRVKRILSGARHVWAYAPELKTFCDGLIGRERAVVIPWPYDFEATRKLGGAALPGQHKILVQVPMCFGDIVVNHPFVVKGVLADVFGELPASVRERITFHTFVYNDTDREKYGATRFAEGLPFVLEGKRGYRAFVRLLGECDGVINLTAGSILGRVTFLAAARGRPGIFSDNSSLNLRLYPNSCVTIFDTVRLRELVREMMGGLENGCETRLLPAQEAAREVGDFGRNREKLREICNL